MVYACEWCRWVVFVGYGVDIDVLGVIMYACVGGVYILLVGWSGHEGMWVGWVYVWCGYMNDTGVWVWVR